MKIDTLSKRIISIALYLDKKLPGSVSEIWIDETLFKNIKDNLPTNISDYIADTRKQMVELDDVDRQNYLKEILHSLEYQINNLNSSKFSYKEFSKNTFGYQIDRVTEDELQKIEIKLSTLLKSIGKTREEVFSKHFLEIENYQSEFEKYVEKSKSILPKEILNFPDKGFNFEVVRDKPWTAFNHHVAPYKSKLTLNSDAGFTKLDLYRLSFHEAYGGHHSELSNKDILLEKEQRGEHGLVITFSPQTFVSEAIAEGVYVLLGGLDKTDNEQMIGWYYDRLIFALQNVATHWYFEGKLSKTEIKEKLLTYSISKKTVENILNFSTDELFGKYAPVYYTAFNFLDSLYSNTSDKDELVRTLFIMPSTPSVMLQKFGN